jgi:hypothetical protein
MRGPLLYALSELQGRIKIGAQQIPSSCSSGCDSSEVRGQQVARAYDVVAPVTLQFIRYREPIHHLSIC